LLATSRRIALTNGFELKTPLLVPSVSSKGFPFLGGKVDGISEMSIYLGIVGPALVDSLLISAYDIHYSYLPSTDQLRVDFFESIYANPKLLLIDSGGYERGRDYDSSAVYRAPTHPKRWGAALLSATLATLSEDVTGVLVNYDHKASYSSQIASAQAFFAKVPRFKTDILLKPEPKQRYIDVDRLRPAMRRLAHFDVIGVTEKELGPSVLERAATVARLRRALDDLEVDRPIHVFGSLDTLYTPLYFMLGAEVFDGLTWLRYGYHDGATIYPDAIAVLEGNLTEREDQRVANVLVNNLRYLARLRLQMMRYLAGEGAAVFGRYAEVLESARSAVESSL